MCVISVRFTPNSHRAPTRQPDCACWPKTGKYTNFAHQSAPTRLLSNETTEDTRRVQAQPMTWTRCSEAAWRLTGGPDLGGAASVSGPGYFDGGEMAVVHRVFLPFTRWLRGPHTRPRSALPCRRGHCSPTGCTAGHDPAAQSGGGCRRIATVPYEVRGDGHRSPCLSGARRPRRRMGYIGMAGPEPVYEALQRTNIRPDVLMTRVGLGVEAGILAEQARRMRC